MTTFEACIVLIKELAFKVLPKATDPIGKLGIIPDTYEWLATKISSLEPNDLKGLVEWHDYIIEKAIAYTTK